MLPRARQLTERIFVLLGSA